MSKRREDLTGRLFGKWEVLGYHSSTHGNAYWLCRCVCGIEKAIRGIALRRGDSTQCADCHRKANSSLRYELVGQQFGEWLVLAYHSRQPRGTYWLCRCKCGHEAVLRSDRLRNGRTLSCPNCQTTHGHTALAAGRQTRTYRTWCCMKQRCLNPKVRNYDLYGGRGIKVCDRWLDSFENFLADMGERPEGHTIDRIDNDLGYFKANCRWATKSQQNKNQRRWKKAKKNATTR